jgi:hypothetical protein
MYDEKNYSYYYATEDIFSYMGVDLIDGVFPANENEIAVERSLLCALGKQSDQMLGCTISLPNREEPYTVTAIIQFNSSGIRKIFWNALQDYHLYGIE